MAEGIAAQQLSEDDLRRELAHLKETQNEIMANGNPHQQTNHRERTAELEAEFLARFGTASRSDDGKSDRTEGEGAGRGTVPGAGEAPPD
jgi:hypothetical protein